MTTLFERNGDRVTGFLKWTDFSVFSCWFGVLLTAMRKQPTSSLVTPSGLRLFFIPSLLYRQYNNSNMVYLKKNSGQKWHPAIHGYPNMYVPALWAVLMPRSIKVRLSLPPLVYGLLANFAYIYTFNCSVSCHFLRLSNTTL